MQIETAYDVLLPAWEADRFVQHAHQTRADWKRRLTQVSRAGDTKKLRGLKQSYFTNPFVKISALAKAGVRRPNKAEWWAEAKSFDIYRPVPETVYWWPEPKRLGGFRPVCDMPYSLRAAHYMIADVIAAQMELPPFIYNMKNKGRDRLAVTLLEKLRQGFCHYRIYDIRDCFQNVSPDAIHQLKLPRRIIDNALDTRNLNLQRVAIPSATHSDTIPSDIINHDHVESGPAGLMQGSPASNLILALLLQSMPQPAEGGGYLFLYGDDLIVVAKNENVCDRVEHFLDRFFGRPSLGPLPLVKKAAGSSSTFEYLGYEFQYAPFSGDWSISLSQRNWERMTARRYEEVLQLHIEHPHGIFVDHLMSVRRTLRGHSAVTDPESILLVMQEVGPDQREIDKQGAQRNGYNSNKNKD